MYVVRVGQSVWPRCKNTLLFRKTSRAKSMAGRGVAATRRIGILFRHLAVGKTMLQAHPLSGTSSAAQAVLDTRRKVWRYIKQKQ